MDKPRAIADSSSCSTVLLEMLQDETWKKQLKELQKGLSENFNQKIKFCTVPQRLDSACHQTLTQSQHATHCSGHRNAFTGKERQYM